jgi:class 3 adenylate cyclase
MAVFISKKLSFALLLGSWCAALGITLVLHYALAGPRLGPFYDALLDFRTQPPVSREILLIETDEVVEPIDVFSVLMTLSEMGASDLLIEVPLLGTGSGLAETGEEFSYRINDEFNLLGKNIRNLFEAIRMGLVSPVESREYVENLVELSERGRDRLNAAVIRQDEPGSVIAAQAAAVFGRALTAADLRPQADSRHEPAGDIPWYSRPRPDRDGVLRRIAPADENNVEHIVCHVLKPREIEYDFPLDRDGNILIEKYRPEINPFRRLTLGQFRNYDQTGKILARLLKDAEALGVYTGTEPDRTPLTLYEHAEKLKEELIGGPDELKHAAWINARVEYIASLDEFLYGPAETNLVNGYEELIATEKLDAIGIARLQVLRDDLIRAFVDMREKHRELFGLYTVLARELDSSLCIMGPTLPAAGSGGASIPVSSALLANALLTGHCITPGDSKFIVLWSLVVSFFILACIHRLRPILLFMAGLALTLLCAAAFGFSFIISGYWIDPFIPSAAILGGTLFLSVCGFCISYGRMLRFRLAYAGLVNNNMLSRLVRMGRPPLSETLSAQAVIIAVKNAGMSGREDRELPAEAAKAAAEFRREFSRIFRRHGALILGIENDVALACFGSPPQRLCGEAVTHPAALAIPCIREILNNPLTAAWHLGIDAGECSFSWSEETGYTAHGRPMVRARIFTSLAVRYQVRAIIGESARRSSGLTLRKLASLAGDDFYELPV